MIRPKTLRARLVFWSAGVLLATLTIFGVYIFMSMSRSLLDSMDDALEFSAAQVASTIKAEDGKLSLPDALESKRANLLDHEAAIRIMTPEGRILFRAGPQLELPEPEAVTERQFSTFQKSEKHELVRVYTLPVMENGRTLGIVQVAQSYEDVHEMLHQLLMTLLIGVPLLALLVGFGGYFLAGRALAPIDQITRTARRISAQDLGERLNLSDSGDEVGRLAATFDEMLQRLHESFLRERQFTADASHELRTPLTAMLTILETVRAKRLTTEGYETALADLAREAERLRTLTENLLKLAQVSNSNPEIHENTDLALLLLDVTDSLRPQAEAKGIQLRCSIPANLMVRGDNDDLIRLFVNLLENAVKYTRQGSISVSARSSLGSDALVVVEDTGIGIPSAELPHIFDRFYRVEKSRSNGSSGLGLAIALEIARSCGGDIQVRSEEGKGTTMEVRLVLDNAAVALPV